MSGPKEFDVTIGAGEDAFKCRATQVILAFATADGQSGTVWRAFEGMDTRELLYKIGHCLAQQARNRYRDAAPGHLYPYLSSFIEGLADPTSEGPPDSQAQRCEANER